MKTMAFVLLVSLSMLIWLAACGEQAPTLPPDLADITLVPFTSLERGISGVAPKTWVEVFPGEFMRGMPDDRLGTLQQQFIPDLTSRQTIEKFVAQQDLQEFPESIGSMKTAHFTWDLYRVEIEQPNIGMTTLDIALAETEAGVYAVALLAMPNDYDVLHKKVFIPAVEALTPAVATKDTSAERATITIPKRTYWPTDGWRTSSPEEQGMDSVRLADMWAYIKEKNVHIDSVTIVRHGYLVWDTYTRSNTKNANHDIYSCTKSLTSALVGIAIDQGYIEGVNQPVLSFFPERTIANIDAPKEALTLEHLLAMRDGLEWTEKSLNLIPTHDTWQETKQTGDWVQFILDRPMAAEPGTHWNYNTGASHLLSAILQETTGMTTSAFASEHLFGPLGIAGTTWGADPQGRNNGGTSLRMTPHDMAKFGYLYLNEGRWDGQQIVPAAWVKTSTTSHYPPFETYFGDLEYGYQWWIIPWAGYYSAIGALGQYIIVLPELDMVVVFTSNLTNDEDFFVPLLLMEFYVIPSVES